MNVYLNSSREDGPNVTNKCLLFNLVKRLLLHPKCMNNLRIKQKISPRILGWRPSPWIRACKYRLNSLRVLTTFPLAEITLHLYNAWEIIHVLVDAVLKNKTKLLGRPNSYWKYLIKKMSRRNISCIAQDEPSFIKRFKQSSGFKEGPDINTKVDNSWHSSIFIVWVLSLKFFHSLVEILNTYTRITQAFATGNPDPDPNIHSGKIDPSNDILYIYRFFQNVY